MCLIVLSVNGHPDYPLVLAANRDELRARPTRALHVWQEPAGLCGGRDLEAGGTWLAVDGRGRLAAITNLRGQGEAAETRSRGELPVRFLTTDDGADAFAAATQAAAGRYRGFNLLLYETGRCLLVSSQNRRPQRLNAGIHAVSNAPPGQDRPKITRARQAMVRVLERRPDAPGLAAALLELLKDGAEVGPDAPVELRAAQIFVPGRAYGTRSSTVVLMSADGSCLIHERRFDAGGTPVGDTRLHWPDAARD